MFPQRHVKSGMSAAFRLDAMPVGDGEGVPAVRVVDDGQPGQSGVLVPKVAEYGAAVDVCKGVNSPGHQVAASGSKWRSGRWYS